MTPKTPPKTNPLQLRDGCHVPSPNKILGFIIMAFRYGKTHTQHHDPCSLSPQCTKTTSRTTPPTTGSDATLPPDHQTNPIAYRPPFNP